MKAIISTADVDGLIYTIRGRRVMFDRDLADIYGVTTKRLNEQVRRNRERFPQDFMFRLTKTELENWRSQFATSNAAVKMGLRYRPYVFTEHGAVMLASVLSSRVAVTASIGIVRAFNRLRQLSRTHKDLSAALEELERRVSGHDEHIRSLFDAIHQIVAPPDEPRKKIGFSTGTDDRED